VLPVFQDTGYSAAHSINDGGVICGWVAAPADAEDTFQTQAVVWRINVETIDGQPTLGVWGPTKLPGLDPIDASTASAISQTDADGMALVVGYAYHAAADVFVALAWGVQTLPDGTLAVAPAPVVLDTQAEAAGVNSSGLICGARPPDAVVWNGDSSQALDMSASYTSFGGRQTIKNANALAVNDGGVIVGYGTSGLPPKAVVWTSPTAPMILLDKFVKNTNFAELNFAYGVNNRGEIAGWGWNGDLRQSAAFLAIPK
jgi:hypothetical protein